MLDLSIFRMQTNLNQDHSSSVCPEISRICLCCNNSTQCDSDTKTQRPSCDNLSCIVAARHVPKGRWVREALSVLLWTQESIDLGEIMYSLCYLPTAGRMTLTVIKCRNLKAMDITGSSGNQKAAKNVAHIKHRFGCSSILTATGRQVAGLN